MNSKVKFIVASLGILILIGINVYLALKPTEKEVTEPKTSETITEDTKEQKQSKEATEDTYTTETNEKKEPESIEQRVTSFLTAFTTFTDYGSNFKDYEPYLDPNIREQAKETMASESNKINTSGIGQSKYESSTLYISSNQKEVIANVQTTSTINGTVQAKAQYYKLNISFNEEEKTYFIEKIYAITLTE